METTKRIGRVMVFQPKTKKGEWSLGVQLEYGEKRGKAWVNLFESKSREDVINYVNRLCSDLVDLVESLNAENITE